jgi:hypothetical protein
VKRQTKKHMDESALLLALQNEHGYMLHDVPPGKRTTMLFGADPKTGKRTITAARIVQLVVPFDSALAAAMNRFTTGGKRKPRKRSA